MSVLRTFVFKFVADSKALKDGLKDADKHSAALLKKLNRTDKTANDLGGNFEKMALGLGRAAAAIFSLKKLKELEHDTTEHAHSLQLQSSALTMSAESLSKWQQAVKQAGGTTEGATTSLQTMHDKLVEFARFGGSATPESILMNQLGATNEDIQGGIKDPLSLLRKLADGFSKLSTVQQQFAGKTLGWDQGTIAIQAQGIKGFDAIIARQKEIGFMSKEQIKLSEKYRQKTIELGDSWKNASEKLVGEFYPALTWLSEKAMSFLNLLKNNRPAAIVFFGGISLAALSVGTIIGAIGSGIVAAGASLGLLTLGWGALGLAAILAGKDIYDFYTGADSYIGKAIERWPVLGEVFKTIGDKVKEMSAEMDAALDRFYKALSKEAGNKKPTWLDFGKVAVEHPGDFLGGLLSSFPGAMKELWSDITGGGIDPSRKTSKEAAKEAVKQYSTDKTGTGSQIAGILEGFGGIWTKERAAAMAGNIMRESSGKSDKFNEKGMYGLGQWDQHRQGNLKKWAEKHGRDYTTRDAQLEFMNYEMTDGEEWPSGQRFKEAKTTEEAAESLWKHYFRPGKDDKSLQKRQDEASGIYKSMKGMEMPVAYNGGNSSNITVKVDEVNVHTQATDAEGMAQAASSSLVSHIKKALDHFDNGVLA